LKTLKQREKRLLELATNKKIKTRYKELLMKLCFCGPLSDKEYQELENITQTLYEQQKSEIQN
jgi:hypothetical protein